MYALQPNKMIEFVLRYYDVQWWIQDFSNGSGHQLQRAAISLAKFSKKLDEMRNIMQKVMWC